MGMWVDVSSSMINRVKYDLESENLDLQFSNGTIYTYSNVPEDEYQGLVGSASVGSYFHNNIKGSYSERMTG